MGEGGDLGHLGAGQREVEDREIGLGVRLARGARDGRDALLLDQPAQGHLAGILAVPRPMRASVGSSNTRPWASGV